MYDYLVDRLARDHADALMADAAATRRYRRVRRERRANRSSEQPLSDRSHTSPRGGPARFAAHPVAVFQSWLTAGQL